MALLTAEQIAQRTAPVAPVESALKLAALAELDRGSAIFLLQPRKKEPTPGSNGFKDATKDPRILDNWDKADYNIGIGLGESNLVVLDFDTPDSVPEWIQSTRTFKVKTARGLHVYFRGARLTKKLFIDGKIVGDMKSTGGYVLAAGSVHPDGPVYTITDNSPVVPTPERISELLKGGGNEKPVDVSPNGERVARGDHDTYLHRVAGKLRYSGMEEEAIFNALVEIVEKRFDNYGSDYVDMCRKHAKNIVKKPVGKDDRMLFGGKEGGTTVQPAPRSPESMYTGTLTSVTVEEDASTESIPPFDPTVINGIFVDFVELMTRGTTLAPQFAYAITKTVVGSRMAGKVKFENLDVEPRYYTALIGETGSGKGEAWRRMQSILNANGATNNPSGIKVINSADSGAGIRDVFLDQQPSNVLPVMMFIDEIESFGNKGNSTRNPAIIDMLIELADSTSLSRVLSGKKSGGEKSTNNARLSSVMCGQDGATYMKAFAGRTKLGLWDRLYPEYSEAVEAGDLPAIDPSDAFKLLAKLNALDYSGTMTIDENAKMWLEDFWNGQPLEVRKKVRWKKALMMDAYLSAFGRGSKVVELEDIDIAIRIFRRQLIIRRVCFTSEVPDRTGYYLGLIKRITEHMRKQLAAGMKPELVAVSRRDYERRTNATRDNEEHLFSKAWETHHRVHLMPYDVTKANGHKYSKYLPIPEE